MEWQEWAVLLAAILMLLAFAPIPGNAQSPDLPTEYALHPGDEVEVYVLDMEEIGKSPVRIGARGTIDLPVVGRIEASGLTSEELETQISEVLKRYLRKPDVTVSITEMTGHPVTVLGSVRQPGVQQIRGTKTLMEVLSEAGGLSPDAGYSIRIARLKDRGTIPLEDVHEDESGRYWIAEVGVREVLEGEAPAKNIRVMPDDVVTVPRGRLVYVMGAVKQSGGFVLGERQRMTVLEALSMAGGFGRFPKKSQAKILRKVPGSETRQEIAVNLKKLLKESDSDIPMEAEDILFVPKSGGKQAAVIAGGAAIAVVTGALIWRSGTR